MAATFDDLGFTETKLPNTPTPPTEGLTDLGFSLKQREIRLPRIEPPTDLSGVKSADTPIVLDRSMTKAVTPKMPAPEKPEIDAVQSRIDQILQADRTVQNQSDLGPVRPPVGPKVILDKQAKAQQMRDNALHQLATDYLNLADADDGFIQGLVKAGGSEGGVAKALPFVGALASAQAKALRNTVLEKMAAKEPLTAMEQEMVNAMALANRRLAQKPGLLEKVAEITATSIPYAAEFGLTGGAYSAVRAGAGKALASAPGIVGYVAPRLAGVAAQTAIASPARVVGTYYDRMAPQWQTDPTTLKTVIEDNQEDKAWAVELGKAGLDSAIENLSERTGGYLNRVIPKEAIVKLFRLGALRNWMARKTSATFGEAAKKVKDAVAFNGVVPEIFEEYVGDGLRALTDVHGDVYGRLQEGDVPGALAEFVKSLPVEETPAMAISFGLLPAGERAAGMAIAGAERAGRTLREMPQKRAIAAQVGTPEARASARRQAQAKADFEITRAIEKLGFTEVGGPNADRQQSTVAQTGAQQASGVQGVRSQPGATPVQPTPGTSEAEGAKPETQVTQPPRRGGQNTVEAMERGNPVPIDSPEAHAELSANERAAINADGTVTIHRAVVKGATLQPGDFVVLDKQHAEAYANGNPGMEIITQTVPVKDVAYVLNAKGPWAIRYAPGGALSTRQAEAHAIAKEIGASFRPVGVVNTTGMPPDLASQLEAVNRQNGWEFTPQKGSPIEGQTFYVPIGSTREQIMARYQEKLKAAGQPTEAQKAAGNYPKEHVKIQGLDISIENKAGSVRSGKDKGGNAWSVQMPTDYGYIKRTEGKDGDNVDVYVGPNQASEKVYVIDQINPETGKFDEHKTFVGFDNVGQVITAYDAAFSDKSGPLRRGAISGMDINAFKEWLKTGDTTKPLKYKSKGGESNGQRQKEGQGLQVQDVKPAAGGTPSAAPSKPEPKAPASETKPAKTETKAPEPETESKPMDILAKGDWVEYEDSYGKTHQGKIDEAWTTAAIVPTRSGVKTRVIRHEYSMVDADGKALPSPKQGTPIRKIEPPVTKSPLDQLSELSSSIRDLTIKLTEPVMFADNRNLMVDLRVNANKAFGEVVAKLSKSLTKTQADYINKWDNEKFADAVLDYIRRKGLLKEREKAPEPPKPEPVKTGLPGNMTQEDVSYFIKKLEDGSMIFWAGNEMSDAGLPIFQDIPNLEHKGYGMFVGKGNGYEITVDGGGAMARTGSGVSYTIASVKGEYPYDREGVLKTLKAMQTPAKSDKSKKATDANLTEMSDDEFDAMLDEASKPEKKPKVEKPAAPPKPQGSSLRKPKAKIRPELQDVGRSGMATIRKLADTARLDLQDISNSDVSDLIGWFRTYYTAGMTRKAMPAVTMHPEDARAAYEAGRKDAEKPPAESAKNAAKAMKEALDEAAKGLDELFGGGKNLGTGPSFNEETYRKAKPHFDAAWAKSKEAGAEIVDFLRSIIARWGEGVKPYLKRWRQDLKESEAQNANGPMGDESGNVDEGQRPGRPPQSGGATGETEGESGSGVSGGKAGASSGRKGAGGRGGRTSTGGTVSGDESAGESDADQRPGMDQDEGNAEVRRGRDVAPTDNLRIQPEDKLAPESRTARINANLKAWNLSKQLQAENRLPTPAEKRVLMQYSGWGDTFQVFGLSKIENREAGTLYEAEKSGRDMQYVLYDDDERASYDRWKKQYANAYDQLRATLSDEEWQSAKESSLNAHYTSRTGIEALWKIVQRAGWTGGTAIESSAGIGSIIGLTPDAYAGKVHWVGVELDNMTAQMLRQLYPASDIQNVGYERSLRTENNSADLVISNFPFGQHDVADINHPDYDGWSIHNYFLARSVDAVRPGGIVVAITSSFTMDGAKGAKMRKWLAQRADLIGAIRLPNTAFKASAGTEVVTDILVFQKKSGIGGDLGQRFSILAPVDIPKELRGKRKEDETDEEYEARMAKPVYVNQYFAEHPEMVLGKHSTQGTMYAGDSYTVAPLAGDLADQLDRAINTLPLNFIKASENEIEKSDQEESFGFVEGRKPDAYVIEDGEIYQVDNQGRLLKPDHLKSAVAKATAKQLIHLRDAVINQIDLELNENSTDTTIEAAREKLNVQYDEFRKRHGALNERKNNLIDDDPEWPLLASLEDEVTTATEVALPDKKVKRFVVSHVKGPLLLRRVNFPRSEPAKADSLADAVSISINYRGGISADYIAQLTSLSPGEVRHRIITENLAFENPENGLLETPDLYLSGFVKKKLEAARRVVGTMPQYQRNVEALEKVIPANLPAEQIYFRLGSNWISPKQVERFVRAVMEVDVTVTFTRAGDETRWEVSDPVVESEANARTWAAGRDDDKGIRGLTGTEMISDSLNLQASQVKIQVEDEHGNKKTIVLDDQTAAARDMQEQIQEKFRAWVRTTPEEALELETTYNRLFNGMVRREYPVPNFERFPGASSLVDLRDWQKRGAVRAVQEGTLLAHTVGTGKTFTLITAAMEMRRLRTARKPMIVVQNSTLTQFANSFRRLYPTARLLIGNSKQTEGDKRTAFVARMATGDWDAIVIPQSFFERIPNDPEREQAYVKEQLDNLDALINEAEGPKFDGKRAKTPLGKQLLRVRRRFENKMTRILDRLAIKSDDLITFEKLGVDAILVDEAHNFKRGDFQTKMDRVKGLDTNGSDKSMDFLLKTMFIHDRSPDRNVVLATGTPISNTLAEMWTMLRYVRPNLLKEFGVETFDDFVATFATTKASLEETPTGGFNQVTRLARYVNGPEIGQFWRAAADVYVLNRDDFKAMAINVPEIEGGIPTEVILERSEPLTQFIDFMRDWRNWWEDLDGRDKAAMTWVPIVQYTLARKSAIDLRLVNPKWLDDPDSKVNRVVKEIFKIWQDRRADNGTQLIFSNLYRSHDPDTRWLNEDLHLPNPLYGEPVFNVFEDMKNKLVAMGVPESEIADFTTMNEATRFATAEQVKAGNVRIAFGSTESLGTGLNVQDHIVALHHIDPQFRPMDFEQRNGRAIRQGNLNAIVKILVYGVKKTMDSTLYNLMLIKQKFIAQMMTADNLSREFDDPSDDTVMSFQAMSAAFSGNPLFAQRFALENDVRRLSILESDFDRKKASSRNALHETQVGQAKFADTVDILKTSRETLGRALLDEDAEVVFKDERAKGAEGIKLLNRIIADAFEQMRTNFKEEFESGDLHKNNEKKVKEAKKWRGETGVVDLDSRQRTRRVSINGIQFELELWQRAEMPIDKEKGKLRLGTEEGETNQRWFFGGRWELLGHNTASWSEQSPWYNSVIKIHGQAASGDELVQGYRHALDEMSSQLARVPDARARITKTIEDLKKVIALPFEMANRLKEQTEKLNAVIAELASSGALQAATKAPAMDEIAKKFPQFAYLTKQVAAENHAEILTKIQAAERAEAAKSFYVYSDGQFRRAKGAKPVNIPGWNWLDAFVRSPKKGLFDIHETTTGTRIGTGKTVELAVSKAVEQLNGKGEEAVKNLLTAFWAKAGVSPRTKAKDANPTVFAKFQVGGLVAIQREGERIIGQVKELLVDSGEIGIDVGGNLQVWPVRAVDVATADDQRKWDEAQKVKVEPQPDKGLISGSAAEKWADDQLRGGATHLGPDVLLAYVIKGAALIERGVTEFAKWSAAMVAEFGREIEPHLRQVWEGAQARLQRSPETPTPAEREEKIQRMSREGWIPTQVMGATDWVRGREQMTPESTSESLVHARNIFTEAGLNVVPDMSVGGWRIVDPGFDQSAEGRQLAAILKREIQSKNAPGRAGDLLASLLNSVVLNFKAGTMNFDQPTREALYNLAQSDRSQRGLALGALAGFREDTAFVGQNVDVVLHRVYSDAFGGEQLGMLLERVIENFRSFFTDAEIASALKDKANAEEMIGRIIALNRKDEGGRVYRRVQSLLKPKRQKKLATLEADARVEEAVQEILQQAEAQGIIPRESPNRPLPALRRLLLMVSDKNAEKIDVLIANAVAQAERAAGIKATLKNATEDEREDLMGRFAEGEEPDAEMIEEGLSYPEYAHWKEIRDNLLDYSPVTLKLVQDVLRGSFKGTAFGRPRAAVADGRMDLNALAVQPEAEVQRQLDAYFANIEANVALANASGETLQRVTEMIKRQVAEQLEAARRRYRDPMFTKPLAAGEKPTADELLGRQINAGLFRDERLNVPELIDRVAAKSRIQRLTPKLADLIKTVFDTPFYRQDDLQRTFALELVKRFGIAEEDAARAAQVFATAFAQKFATARARAMAQAREAITPKAPMLLQMKKSVWRRIEQAVNSGVFDTGTILRTIAQEHGWKIPTDRLIAEMKAWSGQEQALRELTPAEQAKYGGDAARIEAARREKEAVTMERRIALKKRIEVEWSKLTRPIALDSLAHWWSTRKNAAAAANELASADLLLKVSFAPRQAVSVITQGMIHTPTRAIASAINLHRRQRALGNETDLWKDISIALRDSYRARFAAFQAALYATRAAFLGRGEARNVDRLMSSIAAVERIARAADAAEAAGNHAWAGTLRLFSLIRLGYRAAQALDNLHGLPAEYQEMILQVERGLRELGKSRAEIEVSKDKVLGNMRAEWLTAINDARTIMDSAGITPTKAELEESAWNLVKRRQYDRIRELGLPADDFEETNRLLRSTIGWNERETKGVGGKIGSLVTGFGQMGEAAGVPLALGRFGNAIAISINRNLAFTPFYFMADVGPGESGWFKTETDRTQRKVEASLGSAVGVAIMALVWAGAITVRLSWPKDKEERDLWEAKGIRPGTVEINLGDGKMMPFSLNTGPFAPVAPYLAAGGALYDLTVSREKAQKKMDDEAARRGVPAGKIKPVSIADMLGVAAAAAWGSVMGGRTAAGMIGSITDYGMPNASKFLASQVAPYIPGLPAMQEVMRLAGVNLDYRMASFWDFLLPLPTSPARKVNLLGDPAGTPDDLQRIVQTLMGGNYPGVVDTKGPSVQAYEALFASGYRPPSIDPGRGYLFADGYRPMTSDELQAYTVNRGRFFAEELAGVSDDPVQARSAYQRANQRALESVGASRPASRPTQAAAAPRATEPTARPTLPSVPALRLTPRGSSLRRPSLRVRKPRMNRLSFAKPRSGRSLRLRRPQVRLRRRR